jgi:hypothetical protein
MYGGEAMLLKKGLTLFGASLVVFLVIILPASSFFVQDPPPHVTSIGFRSTGPYVTGDVIEVLVEFDRAMTVTGTPRVPLNIGETTRYANYRSGARDLVFRYTVAVDDTDSDGVSINSNSLELNGGTIKWVPVGNQEAEDGQLGHGPVGANSAHAVNAAQSEADALPAVSSGERARIAAALAMDRVIFNELRNAVTDTGDWVELRNITDVDVTLDGWEVRIVTGETTATVTFPSGTVLPAGGLLLLVNTDPGAPEMPLSSPEGAAYHYIVDAGLILPASNFTLLLRSATAWEDSVGNYFFGHEIPPTAPPLTTDAAWYRARPDVLGYQSEAWVMSGYQEGIGYDVGVPAAIALGTPGYAHTSLTEDVNRDGVVNILDLVWVVSRFDAPHATAADLNGDGEVNIQDLVLISDAFGQVVDTQ